MEMLVKELYLSYTQAMKTAISIPDAVFKSAEQTAKRLGLSRSQLFTRAVAVFVDEHRAQDVTKALDRIYGDESAALDPVLKTLQNKSLKSGVW